MGPARRGLGLRGAVPSRRRAPTVSTYAVGERLESGVLYGRGARRGGQAFPVVTRFRRLERRPADELPEVAIAIE